LTLSTPTVSGATYSWTGPNSFTSSAQNPSITSATTAASGTYSVTVTVNGCPSAAGTTTATVNAIPSTPTASNNGPICSGSELDLSTPTVSGATYGWTGPNSFTSSAQNPSITTATTAASGTYSVTVTTNSCTSAAGTTTATVNAIPSTPTASNNSPICAGGTLTLSTPTVSGATYGWTGPNSFTSSAQNPSIATATTAASGTYSVTVTVNGCPSAAGTTTATVNAIPSTPTAGNNGPICAGSELDLSTPTVSGATYSWTGPNSFTSTLQNPSIASATTAASGTYSVTVTVNGCTSAPGSTTATVNAIPATPIAGNNGPILAGNTLNLTASTVSGATYSWTGPNGFTSTQQNPSIPDATSAASGTYSVTVTDTNGCTSAAGSTTALVTAPQITSISIQGSDILITWATTGGTTNAVQATPGNPGYNTNFVDISVPPLFILGSGSTTTNYTDPGAVTNSPAMFYRVRQVP
jgi:hypothetical protein